MKKKSLLSIFLLAIFLFSMTTVAFAESWYYVGVPVIRQQKTQWCWAASGEMAGKAVNPSSTRTQADGSIRSYLCIKEPKEVLCRQRYMDH